MLILEYIWYDVICESKISIKLYLYIIYKTPMYINAWTKSLEIKQVIIKISTKEVGLEEGLGCYKEGDIYFTLTH